MKKVGGSSSILQFEYELHVFVEFASKVTFGMSKFSANPRGSVRLLECL